MDGATLLEVLSGSLGKTTASLGSKAAAKVGSSRKAIEFSEAVDTLPILEPEIEVIPYWTGSHHHGSSKLKLSPVVNFGWKHQYFPGQILTVDHTGRYLAYAIVTPGSTEGVVRVVNIRTEQRALLKGMKGTIKDLAFAHTSHQATLACVDDFGNFFVFSVKENANQTLTTDLMLQVNSEEDTNSPANYRRIAWCPFLPDEDDDNENSDGTYDHLLVLTNDSLAEVWNVTSVIKEHGNGPFNATDELSGRKQIHEHGAVISDAALSPDGSALATASLDGKVRFFQIYMLDPESPRCVHEWSPHNGSPVSSVFFLDNHKESSPDSQFWKYAVTIAHNNSELKVWSCARWNCLQTVRFAPKDGEQVVLKASLDASAKFLLLSDIYRDSVFVLQFQEQSDTMRVVTISEFATPSAFLCFSIVDAGFRKSSNGHVLETSRNDDDFEVDSEEENDGNDDVEHDALKPYALSQICVDFFLVDPKSVQRCKIVYDDAVPALQGSNGIVKGDIKEEDTASLVPVKTETTTSDSLQEAANKFAMMSLGAFSNAESSGAQVKQEVLEDEIMLTPKLATDEMSTRRLSSPPSQEVEEILEDSEKHGGLGAEVIVTEGIDSEFDEEDIDEEDATEGVVYDDETLGEKEENVIVIGAKVGNSRTSSDPSAVKGQPPNQQQRRSQKNLDWPGVPNIDVEESLTRHKSTTLDHGNQTLLLTKLGELTKLIESQKKEIDTLRDEMRTFRRDEKSRSEQMFKKQGQQLSDILKRDFKTRNENLLSGLGQRMDQVLKQEVKRVAPQAIQASLQSITSSLEQDVHQRVTKADQGLKDAVNKLAHSKSVTDGLAQSIAIGIQPAMQASFKDAFVNTLLPAFERALQNMLVQLSQNFSKGLKDHQLKTDQTRLIVDPILKEIREKWSSTVNIDNVASAVKDVVEVEIKEKLRSLAATPASSIGACNTPASDPLSVVKSHLAAGNMDAGFHSALCANDLSVVIATCQMVNPSHIFKPKNCLLSQETLLSLVQQLGHKLESNTEIRYKFLSEAVMALDVQNPSTRMYIEKILAGLQKQLEEFMDKNPQHQMIKELKMLNLAARSYMHLNH